MPDGPVGLVTSCLEDNLGKKCVNSNLTATRFKTGDTLFNPCCIHIFPLWPMETCLDGFLLSHWFKFGLYCISVLDHFPCENHVRHPRMQSSKSRSESLERQHWISEMQHGKHCRHCKRDTIISDIEILFWNVYTFKTLNLSNQSFIILKCDGNLTSYQGPVLCTPTIHPEHLPMTCTL